MFALPRDAWLEMHDCVSMQCITVCHVSILQQPNCTALCASTLTDTRGADAYRPWAQQWQWRRRAARSRGERSQLPPCSCRCRARRQCPPCACRRVLTSALTSCVSALLMSMRTSADAHATQNICCGPPTHLVEGCAPLSTLWVSHSYMSCWQAPSAVTCCAAEQQTRHMAPRLYVAFWTRTGRCSRRLMGCWQACGHCVCSLVWPDACGLAAPCTQLDRQSKPCMPHPALPLREFQVERRHSVVQRLRRTSPISRDQWTVLFFNTIF